MEFQLNKIDTNVRRKLQEKTSDNKVHSKYGVKISVNADKEKKEEHNKQNKKNDFSDELLKAKKIRVQAVKKETIHVKTRLEAQTDKLGRKEGFYIDTRK